MHNLAIALRQKGEQVSGSDDEIFEPSRSRLLKHGLLPETTGWFPEKIHPRLDAVVVGMHAKADNPELLRAQELQLPLYSYPDFLYSHARDKTRIVIGGSHGKTTITAMILHVLKAVNIEADYMVGAQLKGFEVMVRLSEDAPYMIMEGDEYPSSPTDLRPKFHIYQPHIAVISGIAWDHINVFRTWDAYLDQFRQFIHCIKENGKLIYCSEDAVVRELCIEEATGSINLYPYGLPSYQTRGGLPTLFCQGRRYDMQLFGKHNLLNMEAARLVCQQLGVQDNDFYAAMTRFKGASRRLELLYERDSVVVIRDFAHAPSKLRATVEAVRERYPGHHLIACMELHTYSSLSSHFLSQYRGSMDMADEAIVFYSPHALEIKRLPPLDPQEVSAAFQKNGLKVITGKDELEHLLYLRHDKAVCYLMMSSGSFGGFDTGDFLRHLDSSVNG